jgi:hypothetical protein
VICPDFAGAPAKLAEYAGRQNVLMTHPASRTRPAAIERVIEIPKRGTTLLSFQVAADDHGGWELRIFADGDLLQKKLVDRRGDRWKLISIDLSSYAGKKVKVRLENVANDWNFEFGYWSDIQLKSKSEAITARAE